jgi:hypothetical protein
MATVLILIYQEAQGIQWWHEAKTRTYFFICSLFNDRSHCSSVTIVSDYRLDDQAVGVQSLAEAKDFPSNLCVQTSSGAHPASCPMRTVVPFPSGKTQLGSDVDHSPASNAEGKNEWELYLLPPSSSMACHGIAF